MKVFIELCPLILMLVAAEAFIRPTHYNAYDSKTQLLVPEDKFFYFAYGSNLLEHRIHIRNPSAELYGIAKLPGYRLDFNMTLGSWRGNVATIAPDPDFDVWGALWIMNKSDMKYLDIQEGVDQGWYYPLEVLVKTPDNKKIVARTYKEYVDPPRTHPAELELKRRPSNTYLEVILIGAMNVGLPAPYIDWLYQFKTNGNFADLHMLKKLGYPFYV